MFKVDIHTHIIPNDIPDFSKKFGYEGFVKLNHKNESEANMMLFNENFRTIHCNCWNPETRVKEMMENDVNVQVISPIPIMFSYWADPKDTLEQSRFINDFISITFMFKLLIYIHIYIYIYINTYFTIIT